MSYSISTWLTRNLHDLFGENDPARRRAAITKSSPKIACSMIPGEASTEAATGSIESRTRSRLLTLTFDISQKPSQRKWQWRAGPMGIGPPW